MFLASFCLQFSQTFQISIPSFGSAIITLNLTMCLSPSPLILSIPSYYCPQVPPVFSSFNPSQPFLSLTILPLSFEIFIHPSIHILFSPLSLSPLLSPSTLCLLFTFPLSLLPVLAGPRGMSHSQRINVKESAHKEHVHSSQVDGQSTQF